MLSVAIISIDDANITDKTCGEKRLRANRGTGATIWCLIKKDAYKEELLRNKGCTKVWDVMIWKRVDVKRECAD